MQHQLLIDISALVGEDLKTGIQRVVRSVLLELLLHPPFGFRVEPVFLEQVNNTFVYCYAKQFTSSLHAGDEQSKTLLQDERIEVQSGDIFFGLDLCHNVRHAGKFIEQLRDAGVRIYFVVYDLLPLQFPTYFPPEIDTHHNEWMSVAAQGDGVLCISKAVADDVKSWFDRVYPLRYRPFSIGWFHLGADIEQSIPTKGFPEGFDEQVLKFSTAPTILMVGTVEPRKGHLQVLKAFELLWTKGMKVNLVVVGKQGWMVDEVAHYFASHNRLDQEFFWYSKISDEALLKLYAAADGVVMASEGEGFGLPLIEAAQHGCPVLARDLPVFREVAGEHATYFHDSSPLQLARVLYLWIKKIGYGSATPSTGMLWSTWKESTARIVSLLTDSCDPNWVYQLDKNALPVPTECSCTAQLPLGKKTLKIIAVDLTPVITGGENGGAKVFVLELLSTLARLKPEVMFILLTRASAHKELASLDRKNMKRMMVLDDSLPTAPEDIQAQENDDTQGISHLILRLKCTLKRWKSSLSNSAQGPIIATGTTLKEMNVDLLFCPFTSLHLAEPGIPSVSTVYDLQYKTYPEFFYPDEVVHRNRVFIEACERAALLTAISEYSRKSAINHGNLEPERIRTIHLRMANRITSCNHIDSSLFDRLGITSDNYLLYPANFWKHKNHEALLEAFSMATHERLPANMKLVCTGAPGERQQFLIGKTLSMELDDRIVFPGYLPNNELALLLSHCRGIIFPSLYEGFGLPVIEAMAAGVPVACSNTRALPEVTAGAALLFDPESPEQIANAIVSLSIDEALRTRLAKQGVLRAQEFSDQERMAHDYWMLFDDAINNRVRVPRDAWEDWCEDEKPASTKESQLTVSVVTPSFNQGQFIERTILSVARQHVPTIEHVIFDGGSTDSTVEVLKKFNHRIRWISERDKGQSDAVNKGIRATHGDIIGWLNSDDIYYPGAVQRILDFFEANPEIDVVYGMADHIDLYDRAFESYPTEPWNFERLHETCFICQPALFFRRRVAEKYGLLDESLHYCMDYEYWLRLGRSGVQFAYLEEKLAGSRLYADNKTLGSKVKVHREINEMFQRACKGVPKRWLQNYAHITMHDRFGGRLTSQQEFILRYYFAKLRWNKL